MNKTRFFLGLGVVAIVSTVTAFSLGAAGPDLPADKQAILKAQAEERANLPQSTPQPTATHLAKPMAPKLAQVVNGRDGTIPISTFTQQHYRFTTSWSGGYYHVIAGAPVDEPEQGILYVVHIDPATSKSKVTTMKAPGKTGALTITGWDGNTLSLSANSGTPLRFDLTSGQFH